MNTSGDIPRHKTNVLLVISALTYGGAERQVIELANNLDRNRYNVTVCSLSRDNPMQAHLNAELVVVEKKRKFDLSVVGGLRKLVADRGIDLIHTFLNDANIAGRLCGALRRRPIVISSERNSHYEEPFVRRFAERITRFGMDLMIANSTAGKEYCVEYRGIDASRVAVVHNGVDTIRFANDEAGRTAIRSELELPSDVPVIGIIGNYKAQKNHPIFLRMAAKILASGRDARFLVIGNSPEGALHENPFYIAATELVHSLGIAGNVKMLTARKDMERIYNACDLTVLPSSREGTPNVVLESMACGTPVIATDVADNAYVLRDGIDGRVIPLQDDETTAEELSLVVSELLADTGRFSKMRNSARERAVTEFSLSRLAEKTAAIYDRVLRRTSRSTG